MALLAVMLGMPVNSSSCLSIFTKSFVIDTGINNSLLVFNGCLTSGIKLKMKSDFFKFEWNAVNGKDDIQEFESELLCLY
uniref:Uncharacterized protein n=1 Tax=Schistosoma curassoni TaxID=6186 RepID=A0A183KTS8_9TREM